MLSDWVAKYTQLMVPTSSPPPPPPININRIWDFHKNDL